MKNSEFYTLEGLIDFSLVEYPNSMYESMVTLGNDYGMYWGTFIHGELGTNGIDVESGDVFLDLGANIGMSSRYALMKGAKEVFCYEPDPGMMTLLRQNITTNVKFFQYFVMNKRGEHSCRYWPGKTEEIYTAPAITLQDVLNFFPYEKIDYLKMDIEGAEETVFDTMGWNECSRIKKMMVEHHYPSTTMEFVHKLCIKGFNVIIEFGAGQNYLHCRHLGNL